MTDIARRAIERATADLGVTETPPGSNRSFMIDQYLRSVGLNPETASYPWCAAFISYHIGHAGVDVHEPTSFKRSASCARLVEFNHQLALAAPEEGCVFVHLNPSHTGHAGFVTKVRGDGSIETIEGNSDAEGSRTGGSVVRQLRSPGYAQVYLKIG